MVRAVVFDLRQTLASVAGSHDISRLLTHTPSVRKSRIGLVSSAALVLLVAMIGSHVTEESQAKARVQPKPARNGLIAYSYAGDIYVGNPLTAETTAIVTNAEYETNPMFSPDGRRIAFVRGDPRQKPSLVVVRPDGSAERVVVPGRLNKGHGIGAFAWTPDSASLVVRMDTERPSLSPYHDGELSVFAVFGPPKPRPLTPPLARTPGATNFNPSYQVAPMFRPPRGDRILSGGRNTLAVFDAKLKLVADLGRRSLRRFEPLRRSFSDVVSEWSDDLLLPRVRALHAEGRRCRPPPCRARRLDDVVTGQFAARV